MPDEYSHVSKGKLKLKSDCEISKKKKKKKSKDKDKEKDKIANVDSQTIQINSPSGSSSKTELKFTKAELSFKKMQEKMQNKRIRERASTTHKQQVEKFNEKLDQLTEHFDIPKVSWTK